MSDVTTYIESIDDNLQPVVVKLRKIIKAVSENFNEEIKWGVPTYSINKNICSIIAHKKHVNLQIFQGKKLKGSSLLTGTGKSMRHLKFESVADVNLGPVKKILYQAVELDASTLKLT